MFTKVINYITFVIFFGLTLVADKTQHFVDITESVFGL